MNRETRSTHAAAAAEALAADRLTLADCRARIGLQSGPDAALLNVLGRIAERIGQWDRAESLYKEALGLDAYFKPAAKSLRALASRPPPVAPAGERYLVVRAWGQGFWSDTDHVLGALLLAELSGRVPILHWGVNSRFRDPEVENALPCFFEAPASPAPGALRGRGLRFWPPKWNEENLTGPAIRVFNGPGSRLGLLELWARDEEVVVSDFHGGILHLHPWIPAEHPLAGRTVAELYRLFFETRLRPRADLAERAGALFAERLAGVPTLAVHVRGSDKLHEAISAPYQSSHFHGKVEQFLEACPAGRVFLLTDSAATEAEYRNRYRDRLVTTAAARTDSSAGLHFQKRSDRRRLGEDVLIDTLIAARCDRFVGHGWSNVACMVRYFRPPDAEPADFVLPFMHETLSPMTYDPAFKLAEPPPVEW